MMFAGYFAGLVEWQWKSMTSPTGRNSTSINAVFGKRIRHPLAFYSSGPEKGCGT